LIPLKQKVLHILWSAHFGGIERLALDLAKAQKEGGVIEPSFLFAKPSGEFMEQFESSGIEMHTTDLSGSRSFSIRTLKQTLRLFQQFSVLHLHFYHPIIAYLARKSGKGIVFTEHGNFGFGRKKKATDFILQHLKKRFLQLPNTFLTYNSNFTRDYANRKYILTNKLNSDVVYNGIQPGVSAVHGDSKPLEALKVKLTGKFVVGTSSRFVGFKRIERLIDAFSQLPQKENCALLLVGDGVSMSALQRLVSSLQLEENVHFTGYVERVRAYQKLMDVCVFPSESEPFGLVAIETLSLGKPTIVFEDGGGLVEIVEKLQPADVVKDETDLAKRIIDYSNSPLSESDREERRVYASNYSIEKTALEFEAVYKKASLCVE
jgi:glycosyltransferase involved in cell wall biosynthesis